MGSKELIQLTEGDELTPFVRHADLANFNRYAAVNDEFIDFHMDDDAAVAKGFPKAIGMGNLTFAWLHSMLHESLKDRGRILRIATEFRTPVLRGDTVTCRGKILSSEPLGDGVVYEVEIWAENQRGERLTKASARIAVDRSPA
jgi:acyl dehydratase